MKIIKKKRKFKATKNIKLIDCGTIKLLNNEQISIQFGKNKNDITKKNWGFYLTNSCNRTLKKQFKTAICFGKKTRKIFVILVDKNKLKLFKKYIKKENMIVKEWLDRFK